MTEVATKSGPTTADDADERQLIEGLRARSDDSYEQLVRAYGARMMSVALRTLRNEEDARDCVQDAFLRAFKNLSGFEERSSLWTWLHRIVVTSALLKLRTRRRRPERSLEDLMPEFDRYDCRLEPKWHDSLSLEALLERREVRELVSRSIEALPEAYRTVLVLRDIEGFDTEETAELVGTTPGTVKTKLHRARSALKKLLESVMRGEPL